MACSGSTPTFRDFALLTLDARAEQGIRGLTSERNRFMVHLACAAFAKKRLDEIRPVDLRDWLRAMQNKRAADTRGDRTLNDETVKRAFALVSSVFTYAVERDLLQHSPCREVRLKKRADERATKDKWHYLTVEEQRAVATCEAIPLASRLAIRFAVATGLRQGEQFNLELVDLHTEGPSPHVMVRYGSRGHRPPKSGNVREVPLFGDGLTAAREWLRELPNFCPDNLRGLAFPTRLGTVRGIGKPLGRGSAWRDTLAKAGITRRGLVWHSLRHTAATNLITGALGRRWSLDEVRVFLGHSSPNVTLRYAHLGADALKAAARETELAQRPITEAPPANDTVRDLDALAEAS